MLPLPGSVVVLLGQRETMMNFKAMNCPSGAVNTISQSELRCSAKSLQPSIAPGFSQSKFASGERDNRSHLHDCTCPMDSVFSGVTHKYSPRNHQGQQNKKEAEE
jgi:hypothetical protein